MRPVLASSQCLFRRHASVAVAYAPPRQVYAPPSRLRALPQKRVQQQMPNKPVRERAPPKLVRQQVPHIVSFLRPVKRWAELGQFSRILAHFNTALRGWHPPTAYTAYKASVLSLLDHHDFLGAAILYVRMRCASFLPSASLQHKMDLLHAIARSVPEDEILVMLEAMFQRHRRDRRFHDHVFIMIFHTRAFSPQFFHEVYRIYKEINGTGYVMPVEQLYRLTARGKYGSPNYRTESGEMILDAWSQKALDYLKDKHSKLAAHFYPLVNTLTYHRSPVLVLGNLHIQAKLLHLRYDQAFEMYEALGRVPQFTPNSRTFDLLFRALRMASRPRSFRFRQVRVRPSDLPSPRDLFREMLYFHTVVVAANKRQNRIDKHAYSPPVLTPSSLKAAIETFLEVRDYVSLHVAIRTCYVHDIPLETSTYRLVIQHLAGRAHHELSSNATAMWARMFLGTFILNGQVGIVQQVLKLGLPTERAQQETTGAPKKRPKKVRLLAMPSVAMMFGLDDTSVRSWPTVPLVRIVRRAMLATRLASIPDHDGSGYPPAKFVSRAIANAKLEMIPPHIRKLHSVRRKTIVHVKPNRKPARRRRR